MFSTTLLAETIPPIIIADGEKLLSLQTTVTLNAFSDFTCTSNWKKRDGALGLKANTGSGSCYANFTNISGIYHIILTVQTEFDGQPPYKISINNQPIKTDKYPLSSSLGCDCPLKQWETVCPDKIIDINLGSFTVNQGDKIEFWGDQVFPCGDKHGAYAKWHRMTFTPAQ
jgi:hypothetical protein